jgi:hypothetical protein
MKTTTLLTARAAADLFSHEDPRTLGRLVGKAGLLLRRLGWGLKGASVATWGTDHALAKQVYELSAYAPLIAPRITLLNTGDGALRVKPTTLTAGGSGVACGVWSARHLQWQSWTPDEAKATGTLIYNPGVGSCAASPLRSTQATFRFFRPKRHCPIYRGSATLRESRSVFTRADIVASAREIQSPWHTSPVDGFQCQ